MPIRWLLTVDSEMACSLFRSFAEDVLVFFSNSCDSRKINCLSGEFDSRFRWKNLYHTFISSLLFPLILQPVRINKAGAPLLDLAKSIS